MSDTATERTPKPEKIAIVDDVRQRLESADAVLFTEYRGLNVSELAQLRTALAPAGGTYKIYKNTLARVAARGLNLEIDDFLLGPTGMAFVDGDAAAVAKVLDNYRKEHDVFVVKGGILGESIVPSESIRKLASLPPKEQLIAQLGGLVQSPMSKFAGALAAPLNEMAGLLNALPQKFAGLVKALVDQGGTGVAAPASETPASEASASATSASEAPASETPAEEAPASEAVPEDVASEDGPPATTEDSAADEATNSAEADDPTATEDE